MGWFNELKIKWKLAVCFFTLFGCIVAIALVALNIIDSTDTAVDYALKARSTRNDVAQAQIAALSLAANRGNATMELKRFNEGIDQALEAPGQSEKIFW